jgi:lipoprotein NlpD
MRAVWPNNERKTDMRHTLSICRAPLIRGAGLVMLVKACGCTALPWQMAPEDRSLTPPPQAAGVPAQPAHHAVARADKPQPPVSNGYYRVKPGDTLYRIAAAFGQRSDDLVKWNNLTDASHIETGGVLRVTVPDANADNPPARSATSLTQPAAQKTPAKKDAAEKDDKRENTVDNQKSRFAWPARHPHRVYGQGKSICMIIAAKAGDPVKAATSGRVMFAGDGGKPYGKLIVVKHDDALVTAYGYNRKLLVKEGTTVKRGQAIAEMGETKDGAGSLRFEVRKDGRPVDPGPICRVSASEAHAGKTKSRERRNAVRGSSCTTAFRPGAMRWLRAMDPDVLPFRAHSGRRNRRHAFRRRRSVAPCDVPCVPSAQAP